MIILLFKLVATTKPRSKWARKVSLIRLRSTRLPTAIMLVYISFALKWADLQGSAAHDINPKDVDLGDSDSEAYNYRGNLDRRRSR